MSDGRQEIDADPFPVAPRWMLPALESFTDLSAQNRLGHAYLLMADDPQQAIMFARSVALRKLCQQGNEPPCGVCLGCRSFAQRTHGDLMEVRVESGKSAIGIEQIRVASRFFQQTALYGAIKVLIIEHAESMTPAAANSLLKTLEEPAGNSLLLLSATEVWRIPPTIRSRCQLINLALPSPEQAMAWLVDDNHWEEARARLALSLHNGRAVSANSDDAAAPVDVLAALLESFVSVSQGMEAGSSVPTVWASVEPSVLVYQMMSWCEREVRETDMPAASAHGQRWLLLHGCLTSVWSRLRSGATPGKEILSAELYRLFRSVPHPQFPWVAKQFMAMLGK